MDGMERDTMRTGRDTRGDLGGNDSAMIAGHDVMTRPERRHGERRAAQESEAEEGAVQLHTTMAARVQGERVDVRGFAGVTSATEASVSGLSGVTVADKTRITGGTPPAIASDEIEFERGAGLVAVAGRKVEVEDHGYLGVAVAPRIEVADGGRVIISAVSALVAGLAFGAGFAATALAGVAAMRRRGLLGRFRARRMMREGMLGSLSRGMRR